METDWGLLGLGKVFKEEFPNAKVQRCQVHVARNVLAKMLQKFKKTVAKELHNPFDSTGNYNESRYKSGKRLIP